LRIAELEKKLIQHNISTLKSGDEKDKVIQKMVDMKNRFNEVWSTEPTIRIDRLQRLKEYNNLKTILKLN
jgi:hypothetical protein